MIKLPQTPWFSNSINDKNPRSNIYTGSVGTDPMKGCTTVTTFEYRVFLRQLEDGAFQFCAECWLCLPWSKENGRQRTEPITKEFEVGCDKVEPVEDWLNRQAEEMLAR